MQGWPLRGFPLYMYNYNIIIVYVYAVTIHITEALSAYISTCMLLANYLYFTINNSIYMIIIISSNNIMHDVIKGGAMI